MVVPSIEDSLNWLVVVEAAHSVTRYVDGTEHHALRVETGKGWHSVEGRTVGEVLGKLPRGMVNAK